MKNLTVLVVVSLLLFSCKSDPKEEAATKTSDTRANKAEEKPAFIIYSSENDGTTEYMKLVNTDNDEREWYYWTDKKVDEIKLGVKDVDGLEAVYFSANPSVLYEIVESSYGFSLFLGDKRLQWYEQIKQGTPPKEKQVFTAVGIVDGYFGEIYISPEDETIKSYNDLPKFDILHAIPEYSASDGIAQFMNTVGESNFDLYGVLEKHSGKVVVFYDKEKRHKAATYETVNGKPNGIATVFTPKGRVLLKRAYDHGKWTKSLEAPASANWHYNQSKSNLVINDLKNGKSVVNGKTLIELVPSVQQSADYQEILDKASYVRPFKVNNEKYTGKLKAYYLTTQKDGFEVFELNFQDGLLHGDIKVYSDMFGLTLHEIFENGELTETVYVLDQSDMDGVAKPILYFYPEDTTELVVKLNFEGRLTHTYPKYEDKWNVTAHPDGTLFDKNGQEYYALYWEGENDRPFTLNEGAVMKGENTIAFLEESLETLGLNRREANEFIMYWLPRMENNAYNLIHFSTDEYAAMAPLDIDPKPETLIRVMMVFQPLETPLAIPEQDLKPLGKLRSGFTVVEWGGKEVNRTTIF